MSHLPCKNPNCKSYGSPHPHCKCWGGMAHGGEVSFCSEPRTHESGCEYFADGGDVAPDFIPDEAPAAPATLPAQTEPPDFIPDDQVPQTPDFVSDESFIADEPPKPEPSTYSSPSSVAEAGSRSLGSGVLQSGDPAPTLDAEGKWTTPENISAMNKRFESNAMMGSLLTASGPVAAANAAGRGIAALTGYGKVGAGVIGALISGGLIQGEDEASKWMMGEGDPAHPVGAALARMGGMGLVNGILHGVGGAVSGGAKAAAESKVGSKLMSFLAGIASATKGAGVERDATDAAVKAAFEKGAEGSLKSYQAGQKAFDSGLTTIPEKLAKTAGTFAGSKIGGVPGAMIGQQISEYIAKPATEILGNLARPAARKLVVPVALQIMKSGNTKGIIDALGYAEHVGSGLGSVTNGVESLFGAGSRLGAKKGGAYVGDQARKKLDDWISNGGATQNIQQEIYNNAGGSPTVGYAHGGEVKPQELPKSGGPGLHEGTHGVAMHYPEQNILLSAARGRISNYLSAMKPQQHPQKLAFDDAPDNREAQKSYDKALDIANDPLSVLDKLSNGMLEPDHVKHFNAMHPELNSLLQKKLTERITKAQMDGEKPSYKVRQGLSMFMGTALSGELTPGNIQAAQSVFMQKQQQQQSQQAPKGKKSSATLSKADQAYLTGDQARQKRMGEP